MQTHSLMPMIFEVSHLKRAARECMRRGGGPGSDGITWKDYRREMNTNLTRLGDGLRRHRWVPSPYLRSTLSFPDKELEIVIPCIEDRVVHRAVRRCVEPILLEQALGSSVFGWLRGRPPKGALETALERIRDGRAWVAASDVEAATQGAETNSIVNLLANHISDGELLRLTERILSSLPIPLMPGSGLTPLFTHLRLSQVDRALRSTPMIRVTDTYWLFSTSQATAEAQLDALRLALSQAGLRANPRKTKVFEAPSMGDLEMTLGSWL